MDRTRRLRQARENAKKKARVQQAAEEDAAQLDQLVAEAKQSMEATKAAKLRAAEARRFLDSIQNDVDEGPTDDSDREGDADADQFVSKSDFGSMMADSLKSVVSMRFLPFLQFFFLNEKSTFLVYRI